jgi:hypothetical protein
VHVVLSADQRLPYPRTSGASRTGARPNLTLVPFYEPRMYGVLRTSSVGCSQKKFAWTEMVIRPMGHHDPGVILPALTEARGSSLPCERRREA